MHNRCSSLLQSYCSYLQEWDTAIAAGAAAVQTLQQCFSGLQPPSSSTTEVPKVLERLQKLAPSFRLSTYISNVHKQKVTAGDADLAQTLHEAHVALLSAVSTAKDQLQQLQELDEQYTDAVLSQQLETRLTVTPQQQLQEPHQRHKHVYDSSSSAGVAGLDTPQTAEAQESPCEQGQEEQQLQEAAASEIEIALLLSAVVIGLQKELQWMELAAGSITLDTSPADLETFLTFWQLQPFTNEQAADAIRQHAAAVAEKEPLGAAA